MAIDLRLNLIQHEKHDVSNRGCNLLTEEKIEPIEPHTKIRDLEVHKDNPFIESVGYQRKKKTEVLYTGDKAIVNMRTGELDDEDQLAVARIRYVDSDQFVKLYVNYIHVFFELAAPAQRVARFVLEQVGRRALGKGEVLLSYNEYENFFEGQKGVSRPTFMRGLQELAAKNLIAKTPNSNIWWINPAMIFNGDRARFITEIRRKKSDAKRLEKAGQQTLSFDEPN